MYLLLKLQTLDEIHKGYENEISKILVRSKSVTFLYLSSRAFKFGRDFTIIIHSRSKTLRVNLIVNQINTCKID